MLRERARKVGHIHFGILQFGILGAPFSLSAQCEARDANQYDKHRSQKGMRTPVRSRLTGNRKGTRDGKTGERTVMSYLTKPLRDQTAGPFREK
jgi:hypothetical protein